VPGLRRLRRCRPIQRFLAGPRRRKLGWFLRDFLYDPELLAHEQVDEKALPGLRGVVKISGIRFPQNPCTTCPFIGLCLDKPELVEAGLIRKPGVDLGLFDELNY
jgi:hypothetical protein